eukprot:187714_1
MTIICNHPKLCYIACIHNDGCKGTTITVQSTENFKLLCTKLESCSDIVLKDISTSNSSTIICDYEEACYSAFFNLTSSMNMINIYCTDDESCHRLNVYTGRNTNQINIKCAGHSACQWNNFNVSFVNIINLECRNGGGITEGACWANDIYAQFAHNMNLICSGENCNNNDLYCPSSSAASCDVTCITNDACRGVHIYIPSDYTMGYLSITEFGIGAADVIELICYDDLATATDVQDSIYIRSGTVENDFYCECSYCCPFDRTYVRYNDSDPKCVRENDSVENNGSNLPVGAIVGICIGVFVILIVLLWIMVIYCMKSKNKKGSNGTVVTTEHIPQQTVQTVQPIMQPQMVMVQMPDGTMAMAQVVPQQQIVNPPSAPQYIPDDHVQEAKPWNPQQNNVNNDNEMNEGGVTSGV